MTTINAEVVGDSINSFGDRITSLVITMPRMILAEFNTHRVFSRNSASSRAIPSVKMLRMVKEDPFIPLIWQKEHAGMQGSVLLDEDDIWHAKRTWCVARDYAVQQVQILQERYHVTKQITNRLLEPFMWHRVLVTSTEWDNFFAQRAEASAEPHMNLLAYKMLAAINCSIPKLLQAGDWHVPFLNKIDENKIIKISDLSSADPSGSLWDAAKDTFIKIATAMAAQTSYTLVGEEKEIDYQKLISLHDRLITQGHWSPFEHSAKCMNQDEYEHNAHLSNLTGANTPIEQLGWCGNFQGWMQYRKTFKYENRTDSRLIKYDPTKLTIA